MFRSGAYQPQPGAVPQTVPVAVVVHQSVAGIPGATGRSMLISTACAAMTVVELLKYRELTAVAVGISTQCVYCIDGHSQRAIKAARSPSAAPRPAS
jgi:AhpD family alkylhydroperoxidase